MQCSHVRLATAIPIGSLYFALGKHNGSVNGHQYFACEPGYGVLLRPEFVVSGDFPELTIDELLAEAENEAMDQCGPTRSLSQAESLASSNDPDEM